MLDNQKILDIIGYSMIQNSNGIFIPQKEENTTLSEFSKEVEDLLNHPLSYESIKELASRIAEKTPLSVWDIAWLLEVYIKGKDCGYEIKPLELLEKAIISNISIFHLVEFVVQEQIEKRRLQI